MSHTHVSRIALAPASRPAGHLVARSSGDFDSAVARFRQAITAEHLVLVHDLDSTAVVAGGGYLIPRCASCSSFTHATWPGYSLPIRQRSSRFRSAVVLATPRGVVARIVDPRHTIGRYTGLSDLAVELAELCARLLSRAIRKNSRKGPAVL